MGSFLGHVIPGTFFIFFGIRWTIIVLNAHFRSLTISRHKAFRTAASFPCTSCPKVPLEGLIKIAACLIGMIAEAVTGFQDGSFVHWGNSQHMAMYFFYGVNGIVDILIFRRWPVPKNMDYTTLLLASAIEILLFYFHINGRNHLDSHLHILLILTILAASIFVLSDACHGSSTSLALARSVATTLHGTWFWQVGFILYNPLPTAKAWNPHDHDQMILATDIFVCHIAFNIVIASLFAGLLWIKYRKDWEGSSNLLNQSDEDI